MNPPRCYVLESTRERLGSYVGHAPRDTSSLLAGYVDTALTDAIVMRSMTYTLHDFELATATICRSYRKVLQAEPHSLAHHVPFS